MSINEQQPINYEDLTIDDLQYVYLEFSYAILRKHLYENPWLADEAISIIEDLPLDENVDQQINSLSESLDKKELRPLERRLINLEGEWASLIAAGPHPLNRGGEDRVGRFKFLGEVASLAIVPHHPHKEIVDTIYWTDEEKIDFHKRVVLLNLFAANRAKE